MFVGSGNLKTVSEYFVVDCLCSLFGLLGRRNDDLGKIAQVKTSNCTLRTALFSLDKFFFLTLLTPAVPC